MFFSSKIPSQPPIRIVSLVPSLTELLDDLSLNEKIVGITKFCVHPKSLKKEKVIVGGTKNPNLEKIVALEPDFILSNEEENNLADIEYLSKFCPVYVSSIKNLDDNQQTILDLGEIFEKQVKALEIVDKINAEREKFQQFIKDIPLKKVLYLIWKNPYMSIGEDTFIQAMLQELNLVNVFENSTRYPIFDVNQLEFAPDFVFLSTEPYPFKQNDVDFFQNKFPKSKIILVNGEYFSWYGSRIVNAFKYFYKLIIKTQNL